MEDDFDETCRFLKDNKGIISKVAQINPYIKLSPCEAEEPTISQEAIQRRIATLVDILDSEKIPYTRAFINNLVDVATLPA